MTSIVEVRHVSKSYGNKQALKDVSLSIPAGRIVGLIGKNGMGKTTLIKLINDLLTIDEGEIRIDGQTPGTATKQIVSYLPERTYLDRGMKVKDVVRYFADFYSDFDTEKANRLIKELGLDDKMKIGTMSKGMQEKLQLILVMARKAKLYILDEPLGGVDPATRDYILDTILSNFAQGSTVVLSTHLIADIERILDEVIIMEDGEIKQHVDADTVRGEQNCSIDEYFRRTYKW